MTALITILFSILIVMGFEVVVMMKKKMEVQVVPQLVTIVETGRVLIEVDDG